MKVSWRHLGALAVVAVLAGCGQSSPEGSSTIRFESPAVRADGVISSDFRCGGGSIWLPLKWSSVPSDTEELVVYLGRFARPTGTGSRRLRIPFGILITDIDPSTRGIPTNTLPPESVPVTYRTFNSCPPTRKGQNVLLQLFALEKPLRAPRSLSADAAVELTEAALGNQSAATSDWVAELTEGALASGQFTATYGK